EGLYKMPCHVKAGLLRDFHKACRTCDIDFSHVASNDIEPDQQQTTPCQLCAYGFGYLLIVLVNRLRHSAATRSQIATRFASQWNTRQHIRQRLAVDDKHALVTIDDFGNIALGHNGLRTVGSESFQNRTQIVLLWAQTEN